MRPTRTLMLTTWMAAGLALVGCESSKSRNPLSPTVAGPIAGVTITAPKPLEPVNNQELTAGSTLTLLIENATTSGERPIWLQVEIATDTAFQNKVHSADKVTPGTGGRTTYTVPVTLPAGGARYYWRARALDGANTGDFSAISTFVLQDAVVVGTPTPAGPTGGTTLTSNVASLTVANGAATGPLASPVSYRFELATDEAFANMVAVLTVARTSGTTTTATTTPLAYNTVYFWRVTASDGVRTSPVSPVATFRTPAAPVAPTPTPSPTPSPSPSPSPAPSPSPSPSPSPGGARTPNPAPGQRLPLPNMAWVVEEVARQYPSALRNSCQSSGGTWEFMDRVVDRLRQFDTRWGYNGKRGNTSDPSQDVVDYNWGSERDEGTTNVYIIDIMGGHCGSNPTPAWIDQTDVTLRSGTIGRWTGRGRF
ncbi:hypothetical protein TBR22_A25150 [Luteitalea sp. TBR-22]|uniref:hypothetical protein n=1 Tax=Luteitalea sp. TBR-22 TaxID=2802971 RepID=UPI001AF69AF6|nr:hypothetical protein [Luteitalea sp. TBR-22]BCS33288.1 hypothetical protein TBR22_A25150 [Luteitalea sp. TBR-22]